jgi:Alpha-L-arabinofuranosidase B, catalytic
VKLLRAIIILALLLCPDLAAGQVAFPLGPNNPGGGPQFPSAIAPGMGPNGTSPAASYSGPGDVVSGATAFYGLRAYNLAYATGTNNAITIRRTSDSTSTNILILTTGALDVATATSFCASTTCFASTIYDQIGGKNVSQSTTTQQPQLTFNCLNTSRPCLTFAGASNQELTALSFTSASQPITISFVGERTGTFTSTNTVFGSLGVVQVGFGTAANTSFEYANSTVVTTAAADNALHAVQSVFNGASSTINVDGVTSGSLNPGASGVGSQASIGYGGSNNPLTGYFAELIVYEGLNMTSGNQASLCHNQRNWWGSGGSC